MTPGTACLSNQALDCLVVGPATGEVFLPAWDEHLRVCPRCTARLGERRAQAAAFSGGRDLRALATQTLARVEERRQRRRRWLWLGIPAFAAAATAILVCLWVLLPRPGEDDGFRTKGKASFGFYVKRGEREFLGESRAHYQAGDRLLFFTRTDRPAHFAVLDVEASGAVTPFVPSVGGQAVAVPASREHRLAESTELDASRGREQLVGLLCPASFAIEGPIAALGGWNGEGGSLEGLLAPVLPRDCVVSVVTLDKGAAP